ncbi:transposase (plasmid) [Microvirga sp. VF16]|nr:transposase [Microvirga sp. VF16]QRM32454.1 transposase [Microvirga sp. VF16]
MNGKPSSLSAHDSVHHPAREDARGPVHVSSAAGFNDRVRRTVSGAFHHIHSHRADLSFNEIGFRWSQRVVTRQTPRRTRRALRSPRSDRSKFPQHCNSQPCSAQPLGGTSARPKRVGSTLSRMPLSMIGDASAP